MTGDDFRDLALSLDGASERSHMRHPDFRVNGRIFATLTADEREGVVMLPPDEQQQVVEEHSVMFKPAAGAWGRQGCTVVALAKADKRSVRGALRLAWQHAIQKGPVKARGRKR